MMRAPQCRAFADEHGLMMISIADLIALPAPSRAAGPARRRDRAAHRARRVHRAVGYRHRSTAPSTSRWSAATSATASTCWYACTPSASPATCSARCAATAGRSCTRRWRRVAEEGRGVVALHARARGPRHRPGAQAAGLRAAGRRRRHRRREPRARAARRRPRLRHRRADPDRPGRAQPAAADQQPGQARGPGGLRADHHRAGAAAEISPNDHNLAYLRTKRDRMGHDLPDDLDVAQRADDCRERLGSTGRSASTAAGSLRVAVVASTWHAEVMDALVGRRHARPADATGAAYDRRAGAGRVRAAARRPGRWQRTATTPWSRSAS